MFSFRVLLVVIMTLSASLSGAMEAGHTPATTLDHAASASMADNHPICCEDGTDSAATCHVLPALLPATELNDAAPITSEDILCISDLLLTGIDLSGPLDPPRAV